MTRVIAVTAAASLATAAFVTGANLSTRAMPADAQNPNNLESVAVGESVAQRICSACHAIGKTGTSPNSKAPRFPVIAERYPNGNPAGVLIDGTVVRHPGMPEFQLEIYETDGLVAYIRRISRNWKPDRQ